jgi:formate/nitrite transporter
MAFKTPAEVVETVCTLGQTKGALRLDKLLLLSFLAGAYIALGGLLAVVVGGAADGLKANNPGLQRLIFGGVFPVGLMLVVIAGSELFTGNAACLIPGVMSGQAPWRRLAYNWTVSYIGNFIGSVFVAYCLAYLTGLLAKAPWIDCVKGIAVAKAGQGPAEAFWPMFWKGVGCNWLVCLAVWMAIAADDIAGKILAIWWPIMAFVALGFEHSVANMFFVPAGIFYGAEVTWRQFAVNNLVPVTLGNIVGGSLFVGMLYWYVFGRRRGQ